MEDKRCIFEGCMLDIDYECPCSSQQAYFCKQHIVHHLENRSKTHIINSVFIEPYEETREAILKFLAKADSKHKKLKEKVLASFSQRFLDSENDLRGFIKEIDSYSAILSNCFTKISETKRILKSEQNSVLGLLSLQPNEAVEKVKAMILPNSDWYNSSKVFYGFGDKIEKMIECFIESKFQDYLDIRLTKIENALENHNKSIELTNNELSSIKDSISNIINENNRNIKDFDEWKDKTRFKTENEIILLDSQISISTEDINRKFKELEIVQRNLRNIIAQDLLAKKSEILKGPNNLYAEHEFRNTCFLYENTSSVHDTSVMQAYQDYTSEPLDDATCITQLPNGKLFCFGKSKPSSGITLLIDENYRIEELPSGTPCHLSSAIYANNNIYCFGGYNENYYNLYLSSRFDLEKNQWNQLTPLPKADSDCTSIIFNVSILITGYDNTNLWRYSIDNNSFIIIPCNFGEKERKILINEDRLYLIECKGSIYESEIGSDTTWRQITNHPIIDMIPNQNYCLYDKGGIYIGLIILADFSKTRYSCFKFSLNEKKLNKLLENDFPKNDKRI